MDLSAAKNQADILVRLGEAARNSAIKHKDGRLLDFADHLVTEANYLKDYLDIPRK